MVEVYFLVPQPLCSPPTSSPLPPKFQAWCRCYLFFLTTPPIIMFSKAVLIFLAIGALSVNALTAPVARSPVPEPAQGEFPRSFFITRYHNLTLASFNSSTRGNGNRETYG